MYYLVLCHPDDRTAVQAVGLLRQRYPVEQVRLVSSDELVYAPYWRHRLQSDGTLSEVTLATGTRLVSTEVISVFNRLRYASVTHFAQESDRHYATTEVYALLLSWLHSLPCDVINAAVPRGLGAHGYSQMVWLTRAARAGLPVRNLHFTTNPRTYPRQDYTPYHPSDMGDGALPQEAPAAALMGNRPTYYMEPVPPERRRVLIAGEQVVGGLETQYAAALRRLAKNAGCDLLQVEFGRFDTTWKVTAVNPFPQLTTEAEFHALLALLERRG